MAGYERREHELPGVRPVNFVWTDRDRRRHELISPAAIEREAEDISREIDDLVALADGLDPTLRQAARSSIRKADERLERLHADLGRWNDHADQETRRVAAELIAAIDALAPGIAAVSRVVALHDEHDSLIDETAGDREARAVALAGPMTEIQRQAIVAVGSRTPPADDASRSDAKAWLDAQPDFARTPGSEGGWFAWVDRQQDAHRLADTLPIEREMVVIVGELSGMRLVLTANVEPIALYEVVNEACALMERLTNIKGDLERFQREAIAREDTAWNKYAIDWRSKRNAS